jgi:hypothetical protein
MKRRDFLSTIGAAAALGPAMAHAQPAPGAPAPRNTVLYDGKAIALARVTPDAARPDALWIQKSDLPRVNDFELKPQGACRADVCIPIPPTMTRGTTFNLTAFSQRVGQRVIADPAKHVWSFGEIPVVRGAYLESRMAPDFSIPDRKGRAVKLSQFRGKKVLLVTWASW